MKYLKFLLIISLIILIAGCHNAVVNNKQFTASDFPLKVGNKWVYQVTYNALNYSDTETVTIVNKQTLSNDSVQYTINVSYNNSTSISTQYILTKGDTIIYNSVTETATPYGFIMLKVPCLSNSFWAGVAPNDTTRVVSITASQVVNMKTYSNVYFLRRTAYSVGFNDLETYALSPNVGILEYNVDLFDSGSGANRNTSSTLISYQLN